jgi:hypothetical protein
LAYKVDDNGNMEELMRTLDSICCMLQMDHVVSPRRGCGR